MKHDQDDDNFRSGAKQTRLKCLHPTPSAEDFDVSRAEAEALQPTGKSPGPEMLSNQQRLELSQASEQNKHFVNPIQSFWPTRSS